MDAIGRPAGVVVVTAPTVPALIPSAPVAGAPAAVREGLRTAPLPLAALAPEATGRADRVYALTTVDRSGRVADRGVVAALGWPPGTRLDVRERAGLFALHVPGDGRCRVDGRGYLILALALRRWCRLGAGDRLLLVADRQAAMLTGYPLPVLDRLLAAELPPLWWSGGYLPPVEAGVRLSGSIWACQAVSYSSGLR